MKEEVSQQIEFNDQVLKHFETISYRADLMHERISELEAKVMELEARNKILDSKEFKK